MSRPSTGSSSPPTARRPPRSRPRCPSRGGSRRFTQTSRPPCPPARSAARPPRCSSAATTPRRRAFSPGSSPRAACGRSTPVASSAPASSRPSASSRSPSPPARRSPGPAASPSPPDRPPQTPHRGAPMSPSAAATTAAADARIPGDHPFAAHLLRVAALDEEQPHRAWTPDDGPLPSLYLSHGGGPVPFERPEWLAPLHDWARALPRPRAILVVSAHWEAAPLSVSAVRPDDLVYDFGGFAPLYYSFRYDTPDS